MAASVTYQIKGKYDNKAVKSAQADLTAFGKSIKGLGVAAWAKISTEVVKGLSKVVDGAAESFINQNTALKKLDASIKASQKDFSELIKAQDKLSKNNFFDGDSLANAEAMAINMGLNQKQVISVMEAAEELTAAGIMPLDQAVKSLALSYSGNTTQLSKSIPQLKAFTKEQLANGEAVDLVLEKYKGMADAMANTFGGRDTQFKNAFGDLKNSIGGIIQAFKFIGEGKWLGPINSLTKWIEENRNTIIGIVLSVPDIAKTAIIAVWDMIKNTFTGEGMVNLFVFMGKAFLENVKLSLSAVFELFKALLKTIWELFDVSIGNLVRKVKNAIADGINFFIDKLNTALAKVLDSKAVQWIAKNIFHSEDFDGSNVISFRVEKEDLKTWEEASKNISTAWGNAGKNIKSDFQNWVQGQKENFDDFKVFYDEDNKKFIKDIKEIIKNADIPEDLKTAFTTMTTAIENLDSGDSGSGSNSLLQNGEMPSWLSDLTNGGISSELSALTEIAPELGIILELLSNFENVLALMNPLYTIVQSFIETLSPVVNEILAPIVGALKMVGQILAQMLIPLLQTLTPIISFLAEVAVWFYNKVILPVANGIVDVFVFFKNAVVHITNGIIALVNGALGWLGVRIGYLATTNASDYHLQALSTSDLNAAGSTSSTSTTGGAASYTAARDIYVNIYYDHSFVNGDAQQIAIMLRDEIARAERLGY